MEQYTARLPKYLSEAGAEVEAGAGVEAAAEEEHMVSVCLSVYLSVSLSI